MSPLHETLTISRVVRKPLPVVWNAFADTEPRAQWSTPSGEETVYDSDDFRTGGQASYRCGTPGTPEFTGAMDYIQVVWENSVIHTDTLWHEETLLSTALLTWTFKPVSEGTEITVVDQVISLAGNGMIDGHRNGHTLALSQLEEFLHAQK